MLGSRNKALVVDDFNRLEGPTCGARSKRCVSILNSCRTAKRPAKDWVRLHIEGRLEEVNHFIFPYAGLRDVFDSARLSTFRTGTKSSTERAIGMEDLSN